MKQIVIHSLEETIAFGTKLANMLESQTLIVLSGDLGAGKTTLTKSIGKALGVKNVITSPTFTILKSYEGRLPLHHIDAYRLEGISQDLGFEEIFDEEAVCVVEWFEFIEYALPKERLHIDIKLDNEERIFTLLAVGEKYEQILEAL